MHTYVMTKKLKTKEFMRNSQNINQENDIQMTVMLEIKLQKFILCQNVTISLAAIVPILNPCQDWNVHTYDTTKKLEEKTFTLKMRNIKRGTDMQVTLNSENNIKNNIFFIKIRPFFYQIMHPF